jgi:hypothetical protein
MKVRRRNRPHQGIETPSEARKRKREALADEEAERRRTCPVNPFGFHEEQPSDLRLFVHGQTPTECVHCGRRGVLVILELDVTWDDPRPGVQSERSEDRP